jgi:hypothetical protein
MLLAESDASAQSRRPYVVLRAKRPPAPRYNLARGRTRAIRHGIAHGLRRHTGLRIKPSTIRFRSSRQRVPGMAGMIEGRTVRWWTNTGFRGRATAFTPVMRNGGASTAVGQIKISKGHTPRRLP